MPIHTIFLRQLAMLVMLATAALLVSCKPADTPPPPPPPTGEFCDGAAQVLKTLQCADERGVIEGNGNALGESYADVCKRVERVGKVTMRSECISKSKNCDEVRVCQHQLRRAGAAWAPAAPCPPASSPTTWLKPSSGRRSAALARS